MKVSLNWVKQFTDVKLPAPMLVDKIGAQLGAVEEVIDLGERYKGIVVARVVSCEKHPNADKLSVCMIDDGGAVKKVKRDAQGFVQVVCGAPNVRAGMLVAWIPPGSTVPSSAGSEPFLLEARDLRGVVSNGMLASANELAMGDDHSGILEIDNSKEQKKIAPGDDFAKTFGLDDLVIDIENKMFTHRPDCFGILGVAREIAGIQGLGFKSPEWYSMSEGRSLKSEGTRGAEIKVMNEVPELVPRFMAAYVTDVKVRSSPVWLQAELSRVGLKPINNVVDITNYLMYLTAQPIHAYDADKLRATSNEQRAMSLGARKSRKGDKLLLLNGKAITFDDDSTVLITSNDVPVGIGGIMGGKDTEVGAETKNIVIECASFDMYNIRRTSMKHGLFTDASTRFTKGQSLLQNNVVMAKALDMVNELAGGTLSSEIVDIQSKAVKQTEPKAVKVTAEFVNDRLGSSLSANEMKTLLENVEFSVKVSAGDKMLITPPFWRTDIELPEDIVEEVGRLHGYDNLPLVLPARSAHPATRNSGMELKSQLRQILSASGANELLTYSFVHGNLLNKVGQDTKHAFELTNALSPDLQYYRLSIMPSLLEKVHPNVKAGHDRFAIYEMGKTHNKVHKLAKNDVPQENEHLAFVVVDNEKSDSGGAAYFAARKYLDSMALKLGLSLRYEAITSEASYPVAKPFELSRSALVYLEGTKTLLGIIGEFTPSVRMALKLPVATAGFEIEISSTLAEGSNPYTVISKYPRVQQDISLKVPTDMSFGTLFDFVKDNLAAPVSTFYELTPIDIYQKGETKHVTLRLSISSYAKTLTSTEVNKLLDDVATLAHDTHGIVRI